MSTYFLGKIPIDSELNQVENITKETAELPSDAIQNSPKDNRERQDSMYTKLVVL